MANKFSNFVFTDEGLGVITDALTNNTSLSIEQVYTFTTKLTKALVYSQLSGLTPKQIKPVGTVTAHDNTVETRIQIDNSDVTIDYNLQGVALVGKHGTTSFVLGYINANESTNIPKFDGSQAQTLSFDVSFAISDTSIVTVNTQTAGMLTVADYNALLAYVDNKVAPLAVDTTAVHKSQDETIDGIKKFLKTISGSINGNSNSTDYINQHVISANVDLNTLTTNGNYLSTATSKTTTNKPAGTSEQYTLASIGNVQFFNDMANDKLYLRNKITATTFTSWKQVAQLTDFGITNAVSASKLATPRKLKVNLASTADQTFDGSADQVGIGVDGILPVKNGGSGRADDVNTGGTKAIEITDFNSIQLPPSDYQIVRGFPFSAGNTSVNKPNTAETGFRGWFTTFDAANSIEFIAVGNSGALYAGRGSTTVVNRLVTVTSITWRKLSDDSTVVHNSGNETISGTKTFSGDIVANNPIKGTLNYPMNAEKDLNNYMTTGQFKIDTTFVNVPTNLPNGAFLWVYNFDSNLVYQTIIAREIGNTLTDSTMWTRMLISNAWGPWQSIAKDDDVVHNAIDETVSGKKTFTSAITAKGVEVSDAIPFVDFHYANDAGDYTSRIIENTKGQLTFLTTAGAKMKIVADLLGTSDVAIKLTTARSIQTNLGLTSSANFDGTANITPGVTGILPPGNGGTGRADGLANPIVAGLSAGTDLNTLTTSGYYKVDTSDLNIPAGMPNGAILFVANFDATVSYQQIFARQVTASNTKVTVWYRLRYTSWGAWQSLSKDDDVIHNTGAETVAGSKTFSSPIIGSLTGNADTATKLATARTIAVTGDVTGSGTFDGSGNLSITTTEATTTRTDTTSTHAGGYGSTVTVIDGVTTNSAGEVTGVNTKTLTLPSAQTTVTGNAGTATKLATARTIGGVSFDGTANINLPGVNTAGNQPTSGNAGTATKLASPVSVGGVSFDGSASINLPGVNIAGNQSTTGNAGSATKLQTARTINGVAFDGTANISVNAANDTSLVHTTGNETVAGVKTFSDWPVVTGLNVSNGTNTSGIIRINASIPNQSNNNVPIGLNTGSTLVLGGGKAANSYLAAMAAGAVPIGSTDATNEQLVLAGDAAVYIGAGYQDGGTTGKWWAFNQDGTITSPNGNLMQEVTSTTINLYGKGTYFVNDTATDGDHLRLIVSGKVVSVQGTLMTKVAMSGGAYLGEALIPAQYAPPVARKNTVGFNAGSAGSKVYADVAWSIDGMLSLDNIVNGSNMTAWGTIPAGSQLSFADTWVLA